MTPYGSFTYFGILLYVILPAIVASPVRWLSRAVLPTATLAMLAVQFSSQAPAWTSGPVVRGVWVVVGFALAQWAIARLFLCVHSRMRWSAAFPMALVLALLPLLVARLVGSDTTTWLAGFLGLAYMTFRALDVVFCIQDRAVR